MEKLLESKAERSFQVQDFLALLKRHCKLFAGTFLSFLLVSILIYTFRIPYVAKGRLLVNDSQNSSLQAFSTSYFGMTKSVADGKKGNTQIGKQIEVLRTREFYQKLLQHLEDRSKSKDLSVEEQKAFENIKVKYLDDALKDEESRLNFIMKMDAWSQTKLESDYEIRISFSTPSRDLSLFLTNATLELSSEFLKEREMQEIHEVEKFITEQKQVVDKTIQGLAQELAHFQTQPENLISMTSREKVGEYLSELMVRINETRLKIAENTNDIAFLQGEKGDEKNAGSNLYGVGGRIEALRLENKLLNSRLGELRQSVDRIGKHLKVLPVAMQMLEDKRKKSELEYAKYKELSETLAKVEAQKLSIRDRFEILERARRDNTGPQVDILTLGCLSFIMALVFGLTFIYFKYLWVPMIQPKESVRDITVIDDDHNQDPRVVIENAKIKFQLGNHGSVE
ncbi:hypothetical protein [Bdellovibrio sp. HCB337]|uniref:hypothetical protein n=1 Tax=Bdellovibrio sp. HCB337 TaxID=3394358 RepID=UPI0039A64A41